MKHRMKFADPGVCPYVPRGEGYVVEMVHPDGTRQYMPLLPNFEVEHYPGLGATYTPTTDSETVVVYRQLASAGDVVSIPRHSHSGSAELVLCTSGEVRFGDGTVLRRGDTVSFAAGVWHCPSFVRVAGRNASAVIVWDPPLRETNIQTEVCGANRPQEPPE